MKLTVMTGTLGELTGNGIEILVSAHGVYLATFLDGRVFETIERIPEPSPVVEVQDGPTVATDSYFIAA